MALACPPLYEHWDGRTDQNLTPQLPIVADGSIPEPCEGASASVQLKSTEHTEARRQLRCPVSNRAVVVGHTVGGAVLPLTHSRPPGPEWLPLVTWVYCWWLVRASAGQASEPPCPGRPQPGRIVLVVSGSRWRPCRGIGPTFPPPTGTTRLVGMSTVGLLRSILVGANVGAGCPTGRVRTGCGPA